MTSFHNINHKQPVYIKYQIKQSRMKNQLKLFDNQISGKTAKFTDHENRQVYKELSTIEYKFYCFMDELKIHESQYGLKKYIPKFLGRKAVDGTGLIITISDSSKKNQWINHISDRHKSSLTSSSIKEYLVLQNLFIDFKSPCIMDIKLGKKKKVKNSNKKFQNSTTNSHNFRINGMSNFDLEQNQQHFISKYYFQKTLEEEIESHLAFFFFNGKEIDKNLIQNCIEQIKQIVLSLLCFKVGNFDSASLLLAYDAHNHDKFVVKIIDFDKYYPQSHANQNGDQNIIVGLKYIIWYLGNIKNQEAMHQQKIKGKEMKFFNQCEIVPIQKVKQFNSISPKSQKSKSQVSKLQKQEKLNQEDLDLGIKQQNKNLQDFNHVQEKFDYRQFQPRNNENK